MIGLLDYDLLQSESTTRIIPNLEIMKLATYYQIEENKFCRLLSLNEQDLDNYEKIYFFSEKGRKLLVPDQFKRANNVIYGGSAFTNFKYVPFENTLIDYTIPRVTIYKEYLKQKYLEGYKNLVISHVLDDTYYRVYAGQSHLPVPAVKTRQRVYLFDRDFFYPDWEDIIKNISERKPGGIYRIHPIICNTLSQYFNVRQYNKIARSTEYILDLKIPLEEVDYMMSCYKKQFLADIVKASNVSLALKGNLPAREPFYKNFVYTLNVLYAFWARAIPIKVYQEESPIGVINPLLELGNAASSWTRSSFKQKMEKCDTLLERIKRNKVLLSQYEEVIDKMPYAKTLFDQSYVKLSERGFWKL